MQDTYIYHIGIKGYKDIRPLGLQNNKEKKEELKGKFSAQYYESYIKQISAFFGPIQAKHLMLLKQAGFTKYQKLDHLYVYKINILDNLKAIDVYDVTSTPQQTEFDNKYWPAFIAQYKDAPDEKFFKAKAIYLNKRKKYLAKFGIKPTKSAAQFFNNSHIKDWSNMDKYFKLNAKHGNKNQYASVIPHLHLQVNKPLKFESIYKIT